jgi:NTE family protein
VDHGQVARGASAQQVDPALQSREIMAEVDWAKFAAELQPYLEAARTPAEQLRKFGKSALNAQTVSESSGVR